MIRNEPKLEVSVKISADGRVLVKKNVVSGIRIDQTFIPSVYGRLTAIGPPFMVGRSSFQVCECSCGKFAVVRVAHARCGNTTSCGCVLQEALHRSRSHGHARGGITQEYKAWANMRNRCHDPKSTQYESYGGRGIRVCERWLAFENFLEDMGLKPSQVHSIDRIDNDGNYEPSNCRWATRREQQNNMRSNRLVTANGKTLTIAQWAREIGVKPAVIHKRFERGWSSDRAINTLVRVHAKRRNNDLSHD